MKIEVGFCTGIIPTHQASYKYCLALSRINNIERLVDPLVAAIWITDSFRGIIISWFRVRCAPRVFY